MAKPLTIPANKAAVLAQIATDVSFMLEALENLCDMQSADSITAETRETVTRQFAFVGGKKLDAIITALGGSPVGRE